MKSFFKRIVAFTLSLVLAFSVLTVASSAEGENLVELSLYDLLKFDVDPKTNTCKTIEVFFQLQFKTYNSDKEIVFLDENRNTFAVCVPREDNIRMYDLYSPDKTVFGVEFDPTRLYFLSVPEGAYTTEDGYNNSAYEGEYNGVTITGNSENYNIADLEIANFIATEYKDNMLYKGKILFPSKFNAYAASNNSISLYVVSGNTSTLIGTYKFVSATSGSATIDFGKDGVQLDKYATYKFHVEYASIYGDDNLICDHSEYVLSGKKLLGLREDYPWLDLLISWFGADHWTVEAVVTVLEVLSKIKLVDGALYNDIKNYVKAKKA